MSVDEYRQKTELLIMRVRIKEEPRKIIDRFFNGFDLDIRNKVKLLPYNDLNELVQLCMKVNMLNIISLHNLIMNLRERDTPLILYLGLKKHGTWIGKSKANKNI